MKRTVALFACIGAFCVIAGAFFLIGCETTSDSYSLNITPAVFDFRNVSDNAVTFQVMETTNTASGLRGLSLPLTWTVDNPALGSIAGASGASATYIRTAAHGVNIIRAEDQYGATGAATTQQ